MEGDKLNAEKTTDGEEVCKEDKLFFDRKDPRYYSCYGVIHCTQAVNIVFAVDTVLFVLIFVDFLLRVLHNHWIERGYNDRMDVPTDLRGINNQHWWFMFVCELVIMIATASWLFFWAGRMSRTQFLLKTAVLGQAVKLVVCAFLGSILIWLAVSFSSEVSRYRDNCEKQDCIVFECSGKGWYESVSSEARQESWCLRVLDDKEVDYRNARQKCHDLQLHTILAAKLKPRDIEKIGRISRKYYLWIGMEAENRTWQWILEGGLREPYALTLDDWVEGARMSREEGGELFARAEVRHKGMFKVVDPSVANYPLCVVRAPWKRPVSEVVNAAKQMMHVCMLQFILVLFIGVLYIWFLVTLFTSGRFYNDLFRLERHRWLVANTEIPLVEQADSQLSYTQASLSAAQIVPSVRPIYVVGPVYVDGKLFIDGGAELKATSSGGLYITGGAGGHAFDVRKGQQAEQEEQVEKTASNDDSYVSSEYLVGEQVYPSHYVVGETKPK